MVHILIDYLIKDNQKLSFLILNKYLWPIIQNGIINYLKINYLIINVKNRLYIFVLTKGNKTPPFHDHIVTWWIKENFFINKVVFFIENIIITDATKKHAKNPSWLTLISIKINKLKKHINYYLLWTWLNSLISSSS